MRKQLMTFAIMLCAVTIAADPSVRTGTFSTRWTQTVYTNDTTIGGASFGSIVGSPQACRQLDKVVIKNNTASSSSTSVAMEDITDWTTLTGSPVVAAPMALGIGYPARAVTETTAGYLVTNDVIVAVTSTVTKSEAYWVRRVRTITTLDTTNYPGTIQWAFEYR